MKFAPRMSRFKASPSQIASARVCDIVANGYDIVKKPALRSPRNDLFLKRLVTESVQNF